MSKLSDLINAEDSFLVKLRCENTFDETKYLEIKNQILIEMPRLMFSPKVGVNSCTIESISIPTIDP